MDLSDYKRGNDETMITFIHAADFHLDAPFSALAPAQAAGRRGEQRELLDRLARLVEETGCQLLLLPGDLLDGGHVYHETVQALAKTLGSMKARVFIAPGNHDFYAPRSPWATVDWPENVHLFRGEEVEAVPLPQLGCTVYGSAFTGPARDSSPLAGFSAPRDGGVHIFCTHGDVDGKGRYGSITREEIGASGLTYLALGHVHSGTGAMHTGGTCWAYPGCSEGRGFDELGEKGVLLGEIEGGAVSLKFVPLAGRRYEILTVDVTGEDPAAALEKALPRGRERDSYRILLTGESGPQGLDLPALEGLARPYFYSLSLRDRTRMYRALWSRAAEDGLTGLFLRRIQERLSAADGEERERLEQAARFGLAALENREDCRP